MEFGSNHHTCLLQLQVLKNYFPLFCLFSFYQDIFSFIFPPCYLYLFILKIGFVLNSCWFFVQLGFSLNFH
jgi:hypothetical protein